MKQQSLRTKSPWELLAPAGDMERLIAAVEYGADAVYLGGECFGMRASSASFDVKTLQAGIEFAHGRGVRVYLTCNTLPRNEEIPRLPQFIKEAAACGVDAFIVTDLGVMTMIRKLLPDAELHVSTQAGIVNYAAAEAFYQLGARRVVLARELSLAEIAEIRAKTPNELELEAFVHGAMCISFSGRCLISNYMLERDANRGECAQPCRWAYSLMEKKRPGEYYDIQEEEEGTYLYNSKDLCMIGHLNELAEAGITSFKIEGRAKSSYYVSVVTNAYRLAMNHLAAHPRQYDPPEWIMREVEKVSHRGYCTGFYYGRPQDGQYYQNGGYVRNYEVMGIARRWENGILYAAQRNKFSVGDEVEILQPGEEPFSFRVEALFDEQGTPVPSANHAAMDFSMACPREVKAHSIIRKRADG